MARPAARVTDNHMCPLLNPPPPAPPVPHVGGPVLPPGAPHTLVNGLAAARVNDKAFCVAPAPDTVRGGLITVFIDGSPASRMADKTDVGAILVGSPNVLLGEWGGGPLTPFQARWLYNYLAQQQNIPFEYATDGCFARADRMADLIGSLGIPVQKQWTATTDGGNGLQVPIQNYPGGGVSWRYHVAPVVNVGGTPQVLDPSLNPGGPISIDDWNSRMNPNGVPIATTPTGPGVYYHQWNPASQTWGPDYPSNPARTAGDLGRFRGARANLPPSSGRSVPNAPVHF